MSTFEALVYGMVQGLTDYLPISSSAHLILLPKFLGVEDPGLTFDVFLHFGTLFSTLIYFRKDWMSLLNFREDKEARGLILKLLLAMIPVMVVGLLFRDFIKTNLRGPEVLVYSLAIGGVLLWAVDHFFEQRTDVEGLTFKGAFLIGVAQIFALIPGVSRSGSTITGGRALGLDRTAAARFSFLLSAPVTGAAVVFEMRHLDELLTSQLTLWTLFVAGFSSFLFGWLAISGLLRLVRSRGYLSFGIYRILLAVVVGYTLT